MDSDIKSNWHTSLSDENFWSKSRKTKTETKRVWVTPCIVCKVQGYWFFYLFACLYHSYFLVNLIKLKRKTEQNHTSMTKANNKQTNSKNQYPCTKQTTNIHKCCTVLSFRLYSKFLINWYMNLIWFHNWFQISNFNVSTC